MNAPIHTAVGAVMEFFRWHYTLIAVAIAFLIFWDPINNWWNFQAATVEVKSVQPLCVALGPIPLEVDKCAVLQARHAGQSAVEIKPRTFVSFDYVSPVDNKTHTASIARQKHKDGSPILVGDRIDVDLSRRHAELVLSR